MALDVAGRLVSVRLHDNTIWLARRIPMAYNTPNSLPACIYLTLVMYNAKKNATSALGEASGGKSLLIELSALIRNSRNVGGVYATKRKRERPSLILMKQTSIQ